MMRINPFLFGILILSIFMGTILGFQSAGVWSVSGKVTADGQAVQPSAADVNSIKGWMTLEQVTTTFNVPLADLLAQFELPADTPAGTAIKDLESDLFSVTNLRTWLQARQDGTSGLSGNHEPTLPVDPTATPEPVATEPAAVEPLTPMATVHTAPDRTIRQTSRHLAQL